MLLSVSSSSYAYWDFIHAYTASFLGQWCGVSETGDISWAVQEVDSFPKTEANHWRTLNSRRRFHFRTTGFRVKRGSAEARGLVEFAFQRVSMGRPEAVLLGMALHPLQDSYAHEGFNSIWGHALAGHRPDFSARNVPKSLEMAKATWDTLARWSAEVDQRECLRSWDDVEPEMARLLALPGRDYRSLQVDWIVEMSRFLMGRDIPVYGVQDSDNREDRFQAWATWLKSQPVRLK